MRPYLLLATATALMLSGSASAQQERWTFAVLTIWQLGGPVGIRERQPTHRSSIRREPWGVFSSEDDCNMARARKIAELDERHLRQPHLTEDAPTITTTVQLERRGTSVTSDQNGSSSSETVGAAGATAVTTEQKGGPIETMVVLDCDFVR